LRPTPRALRGVPTRARRAAGGGRAGAGAPGGHFRGAPAVDRLHDRQQGASAPRSRPLVPTRPDAALTTLPAAARRSRRGRGLGQVCASGTKSIMLAAQVPPHPARVLAPRARALCSGPGAGPSGGRRGQTVMLGGADVVVAGGMESMSNVPFLLDKARFGPSPLRRPRTGLDTRASSHARARRAAGRGVRGRGAQAGTGMAATSWSTHWWSMDSGTHTATTTWVRRSPVHSSTCAACALRWISQRRVAGAVAARGRDAARGCAIKRLQGWSGGGAGRGG